MKEKEKNLWNAINGLQCHKMLLELIEQYDKGIIDEESEIYAIRENKNKNIGYVPIIDWCFLEKLQDKVKDKPSDKYIYEIITLPELTKETFQLAKINRYMLNEFNTRIEASKYPTSKRFLYYLKMLNVLENDIENKNLNSDSKIYVVRKNDEKDMDYVPIISWCYVEDLQDKVKDFSSDKFIYEIISVNDFWYEMDQFQYIFDYILKTSGLENE